VRDDREAGQRGRVKLVEHHLVGDDVLDVVGHHRGGAAQHIDAKIAIGESRERLMRGCGRKAGAGIWAQWVLEEDLPDTYNCSGWRSPHKR
jgi:hypothetical protein